MRSIGIFAVSTLFLVSTEILAGFPGAVPPIRQFSPDLSVYPQNFSIAVDKESRVFLGNSEGVLIYDGEYWRLVPTSNGDIVRSLQYDKASGRVYVGGYDAFGFVAESPTGEFKYTELSTLYEADLQGQLFADIWELQVTDEAVYFVALWHIFRYEPSSGKTEFWQHNDSLGRIVEFQDQVLLQFRHDGMKYYDDGQWTALPGPDLSKIFLSAMEVVGDKLLLIAEDELWYQYDGQEFTQLEDSASVPYKPSIAAVQAVSDTELALASQVGKVVFYNLVNGNTEVVDVGNGFLPDLDITNSGDILIVDNLGFYALQWPARWRVINQSSGLAGIVYRFTTAGNAMYALTGSGVFRSTASSNGFQRIGWTDHEAWDLLNLPDGSMLLADSYEIKHIDQDGNMKVVDHSTTARIFHHSKYHSDRILVGTELGLQILVNNDGDWETAYRNDELDNMRVTQILEISPTEFWTGSSRGGIRRVVIKDLSAGELEVTKFTQQHGLDYGEFNAGAYLYRIDGEIVVSTTAGRFQWQDERFTPMAFGQLDSLAPADEALEFAFDQKSLWAFSHDRLFRRKNGAWQEEDVTSLKTGALSSIDVVGNNTFVGMLGAILVFDEGTQRVSHSQTNVKIGHAIRHQTSNSIDALTVSDIRISSADSRLTLQFAIPDFYDPDAVRYRTRLLPSERNFSPWSEAHQQSFVALSPGDYMFEVEARDSHGATSTDSALITVEPQWFQTAAFRITVAVMTLALIYFLSSLLAKRRSRFLAAERIRLEAMVSERTRALQSANRQLEQMAHLDGLTQIPNRRRLDTYLEEVWRQCVDRSRVMAVGMVDVDHFKEYNDSFGHTAGDELLVDLAKVLSRNLRRAEDLVARYGGEEFLVVLPGAEEAAALQVIEDMRQNVESSELGITISGGVYVNTPDETTTVEDMVRHADEALYRAKNTGRNRVELGPN